MPSSDRYLDLIDVGYDVSENPERFEDLLTIGNRYLFLNDSSKEIADDLPRYAGADDRLESHTGRMTRILKERLTSTKTLPLNSFHAQLHLNSNSFKVTGNFAAEQLTGQSFPCHIDDVPFDRRTNVLLKTFLSKPEEFSERRSQVILATVEEPAERACLALVESATEADQNGLKVSISYVDWTPDLLRQLADAFDLSPGEMAVLQGYLNRLTQKDIAKIRNRSVETVKAQAKAILRKTGCSRMSEVVELSASVAYLLRLPPTTKTVSSTKLWQAPRENMTLLKRKDGRAVAYYQYGTGKIPILFIHGYLWGPFFTQEFLSKIAAKDMFIIAISRPGFGHSSPSKRRSNYNRTTVDDTVAVIESLGLEQCVVAAHQGGVSHAFRIAKALEEKVIAMAMISAGIPIDEEKHIPHMEVYARIGAVASKHAPSVMKMMTQLSLQVYKRKGIDAYLKKYYSASTVDLAALNDPEIYEVLVKGCYHIAQQGAEIWLRDGMSAMADWSEDFKSVSTPQTWIHGRKCPILAAHFVEEFVGHHTEFSVEVIEDAGVNLLYQYPDSVIRTLLKAVQLSE